MWEVLKDVETEGIAEDFHFLHDVFLKWVD